MSHLEPHKNLPLDGERHLPDLILVATGSHAFLFPSWPFHYWDERGSYLKLEYLPGSIHSLLELPRWCSSKEFTCQCKRHRFDSWVEKIVCSRKWQPTLVFLPGKSHRQKSLVGYRVGHNWTCMHDNFSHLEKRVYVLYRFQCNHPCTLNNGPWIHNCRECLEVLSRWRARIWASIYRGFGYHTTVSAFFPSRSPED